MTKIYSIVSIFGPFLITAGLIMGCGPHRDPKDAKVNPKVEPPIAETQTYEGSKDGKGADTSVPADTGGTAENPATVTRKGKVNPGKSNESIPVIEQPVTFVQQAADTLIKSHELAYGKPFLAELNSRLSALSIEGSTAEELSKFKINLEKALDLQEASYNTSANTLGHVLLEKQLQDYSGTTLFTVSLFKVASVDKINLLNLVVINTVIKGESHVMPGYVIADNGKFRLFGIEMTAAGDGLIDFGITEKIRNPMRVVDAVSWVKLETTKHDADEDIKSAASRAVELTHQRFNIPMDADDEVSEIPKEDFTASPFGFGKVPSLAKKVRSGKPTEGIYNFEKVGKVTVKIY